MEDIRFDANGTPHRIPASRSERVRQWVSVFVPLLGFALIAFGIWATAQALAMPPSNPVGPPMTSANATTSRALPFASPDPNTLAYQRAMTLWAQAAATSLAPTPTPTPKPPTPTRVPDLKPATCPDNPNVLPNGTRCTGADPVPTPTVMPSCLSPAVPGVTCEVRNSQIGGATPVSTP